MKRDVAEHLNQIFDHLYINPLEKCNLHCKICYTRKTNPILSEKNILKFVKQYDKKHKLKIITFCGGEVFTLPFFVNLVNTLTKKNIFVQIITNGTIDKLDEFREPNSINLIVSIDGLETYHDKNRGKGNFKKSLNFLKKAHKLDFHTEIFSIVTKQNYPKIDEFEKKLSEILNHPISVTYHPRKPPAYLMHHPTSNIVGETTGFDFLDDKKMFDLFKTRKTFPPKNVGCYQISLVSDGRIFGCCEGTMPIGNINDNIQKLFKKLEDRLKLWENTNDIKNCLGCSQPDFVCGIKKFLS